jgi:LPXTG-motif cell wall-anchored protein
VRLQDGLTLSDCGVYTVLDEDDPTFYTDAEENENYTVTELSEKDLENSDDWSGCTGFDVTITIDPENPPQQLYLLYKANLEPDPKKGICNYETSTAWLEYPDPETGSNSTTEQIEVYDYPLAVEVKKLSNEQDEDGEPINLTGAKFVLISADDYDGWKGAGYDIHLDDDGGLVIQDASGSDFSGSSGLISLQSISADNNEYQIVDSASSNDNVVQYFEAGDTWIYGLDDQKQYYLYEIEAPNGYRKSTDLIPFAIKPAEYNQNTQALEAYTILNDDDDDDDETPYKLVENSVVLDYVVYSQDSECENSISITNTSIQTFLLPTTGGMGTRIFYVLGSVLVLGSAVLLITKKRMRIENDSKEE